MPSGDRSTEDRSGTDATVDFFISYTAVDQTWAEWVGAELEHAGHRVQLRAWDLLVGMDIVGWVSAQLAAARCTIALLSEAYLAAGPWSREWTSSLDVDRLIPLRVAPCDPPPTLAGLSSEDLFDVDAPTARRRLLKAAGIVPVQRVALAGFPGAAPVAHFPARLPKVWNVPARYRWFVGRDREMTDLRRRFRDERLDVVTQVVQGMGGSGKTRFAAEYAHRFAADYQLVWWISAETPDEIAESFDELATEFGLPEDVDLVSRARRALRSLRSQPDWLLVFDNVTDPTALARWWPSGNGHVLVTARSRSADALGELLSLGDLSEAEAALVLRRRAGHLTEAAAAPIARALGYLPLAVDQAAAYLAVGRTDPDVYLRLLDRGISHAMPQATFNYPPGVCGSVTLAVDALRTSDPVAHTVAITLSYFAPAPVPLDVLAPLAEADPGSDALVPHLHALDRYALAETDGPVIQMHRFTQQVIRDQLAQDEKKLGTLLRARDLLATAVTRVGDPEDPTTWPRLSALTEHVSALIAYLRRATGPDDRPSDTATHQPSNVPAYRDVETPELRAAALVAGWYLEHSGQLDAARRLTETVMGLWSGPEPGIRPDMLRAARLWASIVRRSGRPAEAHGRNQEVLAEWHELARQRHLVVADGRDATSVPKDSWVRGLADLGVLTEGEQREMLLSADAVASGLRDTGQRATARDRRRDAYDAAYAAFGPDDPLTLRLANNLAFDLYGLDDVQAAHDLDDQTLRRRRAVLGDDHPDTLASQFGLARDLRSLGKVTAAREQHADVYARACRVLGDSHPETLRFGKALAVDRYRLGDYAEARELHTVLLERARNTHGDEHPFTVRVANDLGLDQFRLGDLDEALRTHERGHAQAVALLGADHPDTLHVAHNLARDLESLGRTDEAAALLRDTLTRRTAVLGADHTETRRTARKLTELAGEP
ncbi:toll/interleukin-1 receptor domain-containing protein [Frankia sp. AgW1.1]|nr:toll/interleukin-1 receptor domain-containing protein [Frankia sp. AgW1.1]MBL7623480.1 toll/interleukin-1 receptor domain-containing protein [Frankia sp. AgB1.8]